MKFSISNIIRSITTIFILVAINVFGFHDFYRDQFFVVLNSFDFILFGLNILFLIFAFKSNRFRNTILEKPLCYIFYFYLLSLVIFISMPLRGPISILDAIRVGRNYLILPLALLIYYDVKINLKGNYYFKIFHIIAFFSSMQIIINAFNSDIINIIFRHLDRAETDFRGGFQRNILISKSMIFPHILSIYYYHKLISKKYKFKNLAFFLLLFLASALQGFRVYIIVLIFVLFIFTFLFGNMQKNIIRWSVILLLFVPTLVKLDSHFLNDQIFGKFYTAIDEIKYGKGSFQGRNNDVQLRQIPMLLQKPFWGWGFIYHDSSYGKLLNLKENDRQYGLYSVDSGYITLLMQFGIVGTGLIIYWYFKLILFYYNSRKNNPLIYITAIGTILILFLSLYTHGAFSREFGLLPFAIVIGITGNYNLKNKNNE